MRKVGDAVRQGSGKGGFVLLLIAVALSGFFVSIARGQTYVPGENERKVLTRVQPDYPEALKKLYIGGVVRVEVVVAPNGTVKSTKLLGGSPILGQSTMKAVKQWKFVPAAAEETRTVKFEFDPHR